MYTAPGYVSHTMDIIVMMLKSGLYWFGIRSVRPQDTVKKTVPIYPFIQDLRLRFHKFADQAVAIGMQAIRRQGYYCVTLFDADAVDYLRFIRDPQYACLQYVPPGRQHPGLFRSFPANKYAAVFSACLRDLINKPENSVLLKFAADDRVQHGTRNGAHHDDVIDQVVDKITGYPIDPAVFNGQQLL